MGLFLSTDPIIKARREKQRKMRREVLFFFFNDTATTHIYTLSLHDALPIWNPGSRASRDLAVWVEGLDAHGTVVAREVRSEEHTSELQSHSDLVCRLLL